jgi:hypothetical protein
LLKFITVSEVKYKSSFTLKFPFENNIFLDGIQAEAKFSEIHEEDPYCLDGMDVYSNVLYVQMNQADLAQLAHQAFEVDKYRVETCCIVGMNIFLAIRQ